jgi:hypothetical protein
MQYVFALLLFLIFPFTVYADEFFPSGDVGENMFLDALGYGYRVLPRNDDCPLCVEYSQEDIEGFSTSYIFENLGIFDIATRDARYGLIRNPDIAASLALPPYANVNFIYWYVNEVGYSVEVDRVKVFVSRYNTSLGDLRNVLNVEGVYEEIPLRFTTGMYSRGGIVKSYDGLGVVEPGMGGSFILDSLYINPSVYFHSWEASVIGERVLLRVYVKNGSDFLEKDITYSHGDYSLKRDFQSQELFVYEYEIPFEGNGSFGYASLQNPNSRRECIGFGEHIESNYIEESAVVVGYRKEDDVSLPYISSRLKPWGEGFCITRIPHTLHSPVIRYEQEVEEKPTDEMDPVEFDSSMEVLGITSLPKTNLFSVLIFLPAFLVVLVVVWYYLRRKR